MRLSSALKSAVAAAVGLCMMLTAGAALAQSKITVGAIMYARDSQYWQQVEKGMRDAAAKYNVSLQVELNHRQLATEAQVVDDFITRGVDVIVVSILDKTASAAALKRAKAKGIPIIEYNTELADHSISAHMVGVNQTKLAEAVGAKMDEYIKTKLHGSAKVGLVALPLMNPQSSVRKKGVLSQLKDVKIHIVSDLQGATPEEGANAFEQTLQRDPGTQVFWASNSGTLAGAATAAQKMGSHVALFGIDMSKQLAEMLLDPKSDLIAVSDQQPYEIGYLAVEAAAKTKRGEKMPHLIQVPAKVYSRDKPAEVKAYIKLINSLGK